MQFFITHVDISVVQSLKNNGYYKKKSFFIAILFSKIKILYSKKVIKNMNNFTK